MRLRHAQLPEEARDLDKELRALLKEKDAAVRGQVRMSHSLQHAGTCRETVMLDTRTGSCYAGVRMSCPCSCTPHPKPARPVGFQEGVEGLRCCGS